MNSTSMEPRRWKTREDSPEAGELGRREPAAARGQRSHKRVLYHPERARGRRERGMGAKWKRNSVEEKGVQNTTHSRSSIKELNQPFLVPKKINEQVPNSFWKEKVNNLNNGSMGNKMAGYSIIHTARVHSANLMSHLMFCLCSVSADLQGQLMSSR